MLLPQNMYIYIYIYVGSQKSSTYTHEFSKYYKHGDEFGGPFGTWIVNHSMP